MIGLLVFPEKDDLGRSMGNSMVFEIVYLFLIV